MKQLFQSTFVLLLLLTLVVLAVVNTCQLDNVERGVLDNRRAIEQLTRGGAPVDAPSATALADIPADMIDPAFGYVVSNEERQALADPNNLLVPRRRPFVNAAKVVRGGTLRTHWGNDPPGLNPYASPNTVDLSNFERFLGNQLASRHLDNPDLWSPELALKVTTPDNGLSYVVQLRRGVLWHEPAVDWASGRYEWLRGEHELTSDDYAFAFEAIMNPQVGGKAAALRAVLSAFARLEVIDRYSFKVIFKERLFTNLPLGVLERVPLPRWLYMYDEGGHKLDAATWGLKLNEHWYNQRFVGTGPYRFVAFEPGVKIELRRNERYWGEAPAFERVLYRIVKDQQAVPRLLRAGDMDFGYLMPEQFRTEVLEAKGPILGRAGLTEIRQPTMSFFYIGWNAQLPFFSDKRVRQAMTLAFDREGIVRNVFYGLGKVTSGPFPMQSPCYDATVSPWPYDLQAAAHKLDEAGWRDSDGDGIRDKLVNGERRPFAFTLLIFGSSNEYATIANIYREALLQVGVRMQPVALDWAAMLKKMDEKDFGGFTGGWVADWEAQLMQLWHSKEADKPKSSNRVGFRNARADAIAEALDRELDPAKRATLCHEFHRLVHEEQPYTFFFQREQPVIYWSHMNRPEFPLVWPYRDIRYYSFNEARP